MPAGADGGRQHAGCPSDGRGGGGLAGPLRDVADHVVLPAVPRASAIRPRHDARRRRPRSASSPEAAPASRRAFALEAAAARPARLQRLFRQPYPLPKLDNIAAPGRSQFFGAMENWGAIFTFEYVAARRSGDLDREPTASASSPSPRTRWRTSGSAISSPWPGGTTSGSTRASPPGWRAATTAKSIPNGSRARRGRRPRGGDGARRLRDHPPDRPAHRDRRPGQPGLRRDHLPEGRGGDPHARGLCRRGCVARRRARLYQARTPTATP